MSSLSILTLFDFTCEINEYILWCYNTPPAFFMKLNALFCILSINVTLSAYVNNLL